MADPDDIKKVAAVRCAAAQVDWSCEVKTHFQDRNIGCKYGPIAAINWFFENEQQGIILEDDCLPSQSFFWFCEELLDRYRDDRRIWQISGTTFLPENITVPGSDYFFSRYGPTWGWASWRRAWKHYDGELSRWPEMRQPKLLDLVYSDPHEREAKLRIGNKLFENSMDAWDYQWGMAKNYNNALSIVPVKNQIVNLGFGEDATHTHVAGRHVPKSVVELNSGLIHPAFIVPDRFHERAYARRMFHHKRSFNRFRSIKWLRAWLAS